MNDYQKETEKLAILIFKDQHAALDWLNRENVILGGMRPIDVMQTEDGNIAVRRILTTIGSGGMV